MFDDIKKEIDDTLDHLNPFENICSEGYSGNNILPSHVKKFIADKKATQKELILLQDKLITKRKPKAIRKTSKTKTIIKLQKAPLRIP